jgi:hypothetical protein
MDFEVRRSKALSLPEDNFYSAAPIFVQSNTRDLNLGGKIFQQFVSGCVESQSWRNQPYHRRFRIQFDARKIPVALKIAFALMASHSQPIIDSLNRQLNIFGCFQLDHNQAPMLCDAEQIDYAAVSRSERGNL